MIGPFQVWCRLLTPMGPLHGLAVAVYCGSLPVVQTLFPCPLLIGYGIAGNRASNRSPGTSHACRSALSRFGLEHPRPYAFGDHRLPNPSASKSADHREHYIDFPFKPENQPPNVQIREPEPVNILTALAENESVVKKESDPEQRQSLLRGCSI